MREMLGIELREPRFGLPFGLSVVLEKVFRKAYSELLAFVHECCDCAHCEGIVLILQSDRYWSLRAWKMMILISIERNKGRATATVQSAAAI